MMLLRSRPRAGVRRWLALLVLAVMVPLLVFGWVTLRWMTKSHEESFTRGQADTVRALALAVNGEVRAWTAVVMALAESPSLRPDRLAEFYEEARQVAAPHDGWVVLTVASGEQLLNTLRPYGAPLAKTSSPETIEAVFRDRKPIVSDVFYGQNAQRYLVAVAVPVVRRGQVVYCLTLNFAPQRLSRVLQSQQLPPTWNVAINDRQGRVVARSPHIEQRIGMPTVTWLAEAIRVAEQGIATGPLTDGRVGQVAFRRLQEVPWTVTMSIPVAEFPSDRPVQRFTLLGVLLGLSALGVTLYISRRITAPIGLLAANAAALVKGEAPDLGGPLPLPELQELRQALVKASANAQALHREQARAAVAEERAEAVAAAAQALQASELRYRGLVELAPDAVLVHQDRRIVYANAAALRLYGAESFEQLRGKDMLELAHHDEHEAVRARVQQVQDGGVAPLHEFRHVRLDGQEVPVEATAAPVDWQGRRAVQAIIRDITDRRQAEQALRESQEDLNRAQTVSHTGSWRLDTRSNELRWSDETYRMFGIPQGTPLTYELFLRAVHPEDREYVDAKWTAALRGAPYDIEHRIVVGDTVKWVRERAGLEFDKGGWLLGGFGTVQDITALKRAEEALRKTNDELERRVRERTAELSEAIEALEQQAQQLRALAAELTLAEQRERRRLAGVLHDGLQQLLVAARVRAHMLGRSSDPEVRHGCQEIVTLLEEALAEARTLTGELSPPTLQRGGLLPALEWLARWMGEKHHLTVTLRPPRDPLPPLAEDLSVLLYQAVRELLFNTVKYAQVLAAEVVLAQEGETLTLTVADAGVGFDPTRLRVAGGVEGGFGLLGIRERLELLGGRLDIESHIGRGSRIRLVAPRRA